MTPVASIPKILGNVTAEGGECPCRVKSSERLRPKAFMLIRTCPDLGFGMGRFSSLRASGPPDAWSTAARIVKDIALVGIWRGLGR